MDKAICPHCMEEIDHLDFENSITCYGSEGGTCNLDGDDMDFVGDIDYGDSETDSTRYNCPECGEEIEYIHNLVIAKENIINKSPRLNEDGKIIKEKKQKKPAIELREDDNYHVMQVESLLCIECGNKNNPIDENEETIFCTKCGAEIKRLDAKIIHLNNN